MNATKSYIEELRILETELWLESTRFDKSHMERILAEDFTEVGRSGRIHSRESILSDERKPIDASIPLDNFNVRLLSSSVALVTYNSLVTWGGIVEKGRRSSVWLRAGNSWQLKFHQGTPYE